MRSRRGKSSCPTHTSSAILAALLLDRPATMLRGAALLAFAQLATAFREVATRRGRAPSATATARPINAPQRSRSAVRGDKSTSRRRRRPHALRSCWTARGVRARRGHPDQMSRPSAAPRYRVESSSSAAPRQLRNSILNRRAAGRQRRPGAVDIDDDDRRRDDDDDDGATTTSTTRCAPTPLWEERVRRSPRLTLARATDVHRRSACARGPSNS